MPRGQVLTEAEKGYIRASIDQGVSNRETARRIGRSEGVVRSFLKFGINYGTVKRTGRPPKISPRTQRAIFHLATTHHKTCRSIRDSLNLPVSTRRVQQIMRANPIAEYTKRKAKPGLKKQHKLRRLEFAKKYVDFGQSWSKVIFSDEKKFNLDGPDCVQFYWHDLRKEKEVRMSRNFGGGSLMVWGGFSFAGTLPIAWITTRMNAGDYVELLEIALVNHAEDLMDPDFIFQQDNASIHTARQTKEFLQSRNIPVLDWPACSPDLNPIENLWGWLVRKVYYGGVQYDSVGSLKNAVRVAWTEIPKSLLEKLVQSMKDRLIDVIANAGGPTKY